MGTQTWHRPLFRCNGVPALSAVLLFLSALTPASVAENYTYKPGEYAVITNGKSPDGRFSIAAHGDGDDGYDNFHIYLIAEPGHKKIGPLEEIVDFLDTGPKSFYASWSKDSRHVVITHQLVRHIEGWDFYRIEHGRAYPVKGPSLLDAALSSAARKHKGLNDLHTAECEFTWTGPKTFRLVERCYYYPTSPDLAKAIGKYGSLQKETIDDDKKIVKYGVTFAAEGICELTEGDKYRVKSVRPAAAQ